MRKYTIIRNDDHYYQYCNELEKLTTRYSSNPSDKILDDIDTLTLLIDKYDEENNTFDEFDPIQLLKSLMEENEMKNKDLVKLLEVSKGHISDILNYKKGISKKIIRVLSDRFKVRQEAFNRPYPLISKVNRKFKHARVMNTKKNLELA